MPVARLLICLLFSLQIDPVSGMVINLTDLKEYMQVKHPSPRNPCVRDGQFVRWKHGELIMVGNKEEIKG